jgi:dimethylargininase
MPIALTRSVPRSIVNCELTHLTREPIDRARAAEQHRRYEEALAAMGYAVERLPPLPDLPDSVFVEDTAVVLPELAVIARPGAASRRPEVPSVADAIRPHRSLSYIEDPGTMDGGDILVAGSTIYAGETTRTNPEGIRQLAGLVAVHGYSVRTVKVSGCLHLKSAATRVAERVILVNPALVDPSCFEGLRQIEVHAKEPLAANALLAGDALIYSASYPETRRILEHNGIEVYVVETDELHKAEGAVTCCCILIA